MGSVWQAFHVDLHASVALKFIRPDSDGGTRSLARFQREARVLAQLRSPHIVQVLDFGVDEQAPYIAMELLTGEDLSVLLARRVTLTPPEMLPLILEAARGLGVAHQAGVIHRDIKPSNLFVVDGQGSSRIKLIDFGIAKVSDGDSSETTEGLVLGSPAFMSPEQARGAQVTTSADVWSLAAVAFRMLTGRAPIEGTSPSDTVVRICTESPPLVSAVRPELGTAFDDVFESAFCRNAQERLVDLQVFARRMREALALYDPNATLPQWENEWSPRGRAPSMNPSVGRSDAEPTKSLAVPALAAGRVGRDSETASISLARNAPASQNAPGSAVAYGGRWTWLIAAAAVLLIGWGTTATRSGAPRPSPGSLRVQQVHLDHSSSQSADQGASLPTPLASAVQSPPPTQPSAAGRSSAEPAQPKPKRAPSPTAKRSRPTVARASSTATDPHEASSSSTRSAPSSPDRDPVFGLPVSEP